MSLLDKYKQTEEAVIDLVKESRITDRASILPTGIYDAIITKAYVYSSERGALMANITFNLTSEDNLTAEIEQRYVLSKVDGKFYYASSNRNAPKRLLPDHASFTILYSLLDKSISNATQVVSAPMDLTSVPPFVHEAESLPRILNKPFKVGLIVTKTNGYGDNSSNIYTNNKVTHVFTAEGWSLSEVLIGKSSKNGDSPKDIEKFKEKFKEDYILDTSSSQSSTNAGSFSATPKATINTTPVNSFFEQEDADENTSAQSDTIPF